MECTLEREKAAQHAEAAADELARALAFVGNSFLAPMSQTSDAALDRAFWAAFPDFGSEEAACALDGLFAWAAEGENVPRAERVRAVSVEYARLFIGPPEPAVAPWESFYVQEGVTNGFGEPTFRMRERLRQAAPRGVEREQPVRRSYRYRASLLQRACSAGGLGRPCGDGRGGFAGIVRGDRPAPLARAVYDGAL